MVRRYRRRWRSNGTSTTGGRARRSRMSPAQHNAKFGYDGGYFAQTRSQQNRQHAPGVPLRHAARRRCYNAANPAASTCGNTSLYYPNDPFNQARRPVPDRGSTSIPGRPPSTTGCAYTGFYVQDQWTLKRFTLSGAIRYDHAIEQLPRDVHPGPRQRAHARATATSPTCPCRLAGRLPGRKATARPRPTACPTTTSLRGGAWRGTSSARARRRSS